MAPFVGILLLESYSEKDCYYENKEIFFNESIILENNLFVEIVVLFWKCTILNRK